MEEIADQQQRQRPKSDDEVLEAVGDMINARTRAPRLNMDFDEETLVNEIQFDHDDPKIAAALAMYDVGTGDAEFYQGLLKQVASLGAPGSTISEDATNFALSVIRAVDPQNEVEARLAVQMAATHMATMTFAKRLNHVETIPQQDSAERALNKLARTFTTQMETLKRFRSKAHQTVRVERVEVGEGGQAIVGEVNMQGRGHGK